MWGRLMYWTTPKKKNRYDYGWDVIKKGPLWHTKDMWFPFVAGILIGVMLGLLI